MNNVTNLVVMDFTNNMDLIADHQRHQYVLFSYFLPNTEETVIIGFYSNTHYLLWALEIKKNYG